MTNKLLIGISTGSTGGFALRSMPSTQCRAVLQRVDYMHGNFLCCLISTARRVNSMLESAPTCFAE
jgi:hypothetical protein